VTEKKPVETVEPDVEVREKINKAQNRTLE